MGKAFYTPLSPLLIEGIFCDTPLFPILGETPQAPLYQEGLGVCWLLQTRVGADHPPSPLPSREGYFTAGSGLQPEP